MYVLQQIKMIFLKISGSMDMDVCAIYPYHRIYFLINQLSKLIDVNMLFNSSKGWGKFWNSLMETNVQLSPYSIFNQNFCLTACFWKWNIFLPMIEMRKSLNFYLFNELSSKLIFFFQVIRVCVPISPLLLFFRVKVSVVFTTYVVRIWGFHYRKSLFLGCWKTWLMRWTYVQHVWNVLWYEYCN